MVVVKGDTTGISGKDQAGLSSEKGGPLVDQRDGTEETDAVLQECLR